LNPSDGFAMSPESLHTAADLTRRFVARLHDADATGLGAATEDAVGEARVARALTHAYHAWSLGLDILLRDGWLMAQHLAATADTTTRADRAAAAGFTPRPAAEPRNTHPAQPTTPRHPDRDVIPGHILTVLCPEDTPEDATEAGLVADTSTASNTAGNPAGASAVSAERS
jgi:hypothetical protein